MTQQNEGPGASNAFAWSLLNTLVSRAGTLGIGIVLARVLGPESFGTFAVALVALMAVLSFNELGVSLAIVRWPGDPAKIVPTVNTISVAGSAIFCAGAAIAAPAFTAAMGDPEATDVVRVLILSVFINGVVASPAALLQRDFKEKTRLGIDQVNVWTGAVLSVVLALTGMGAMALAVGRVAGSLISGAMFLAASPQPYRFGLDRSQLGPLLRFGLPLAGTSIIFFAVGYADQLTAGSMLGPAILAFYVLAFNLSNWPVSILAQPLRRVAPAAFSTLQQDKVAMNSALVSVVAVLASATLPPVMFVAGSAEPLVELIYGKEWLPAAAALSWLVVAAVSRIFSDLAYDFMVVQGKSGTVFIVQAGSLLVLVPALAAGAALNGLSGLAMAQALVSGCVLVPLCLWQLSRTGFPVRALYSAVLIPALVSIAVGTVSLGLTGWLPAPWMELPSGAALAACTAAVLVYRRRHDIRLLRTVGRGARSEVGELIP